MSIGGVVIQFVADTGKAVRDIGKLNAQLGKTDDTTKKTGGTFDKMRGTWGKVAGAAAIAAPIVGAIGTALLAAGQAAMEDKKQADNLARTLARIPGVTQAAIDANADWIDSMELATLVSDTELREAVGKLALATGNLTEAQKLTALAVDTATGSNRSLKSITDAIVKAQGGQTTQLKRMFPWLDKNKDGTLTLKEATNGLAKAYGGAAAAAAKNDPQKRLAAIYSQMSEAIGEALLPALEQFSDWMADSGNQKDIRDMIGLLGSLSRVFGQQLLNAVHAVTWAIEAFNRAVDKIKSIRLPTLPSGGGGMPWSATPTAAGRAAAPPAPAVPQPQAVLVTEEQIYRAVERLLLRGQSRNGRLPRVS